MAAQIFVWFLLRSYLSLPCMDMVIPSGVMNFMTSATNSILILIWLGGNGKLPHSLLIFSFPISSLPACIACSVCTNTMFLLLRCYMSYEHAGNHDTRLFLSCFWDHKISHSL